MMQWDKVLGWWDDEDNCERYSREQKEEKILEGRIREENKQCRIKEQLGEGEKFKEWKPKAKLAHKREMEIRDLLEIEDVRDLQEERNRHRAKEIVATDLEKALRIYGLEKEAHLGISLEPVRGEPSDEGRALTRIIEEVIEESQPQLTYKNGDIREATPTERYFHERALELRVPRIEVFDPRRNHYVGIAVEYLTKLIDEFEESDLIRIVREGEKRRITTISEGESEEAALKRYKTYLTEQGFRIEEFRTKIEMIKKIERQLIKGTTHIPYKRKITEAAFRIHKYLELGNEQEGLYFRMVSIPPEHRYGGWCTTPRWLSNQVK